MIRPPKYRIKRVAHRGCRLGAYRPRDVVCRDALPRVLHDIMQGEAGRCGGTPNSIIRMDRLPLGEKHCGVGDRGQSSMLVVLGWSIVLECIGQQLPLQALLLCLLVVDKGVLGACRDVTL